MLKKQGLTRREKITSSHDFERIKRKSRRLESTHFIVLTASNELNIARLGIIVSKKTGIAVKRNRIKRMIRTFFRLNKDHLAKIDYIFIAKNNINKLKYNDVEKELWKLLCIK